MSKKNRDTDRTARAAAAMAEQKRQESKRRNLMIGGVVAVVLVILLGGFFVARALDTTNDVAAPTSGSDLGLTIGQDDAPHTVVIYEDFLCPYCGELERATREDLMQLADDGTVQVEYRPFNLLSSISDYSARSAAAFSLVLEQSGPEVAKKFHDLLFENQPSEQGPFPDDAAIIALAVKAGADEGDLTEAMANGDGEQWVTDATQAALDAGVKGTPTIILDGEVFQDGRTMDEIGQNLIDQLQG